METPSRLALTACLLALTLTLTHVACSARPKCPPAGTEGPTMDEIVYYANVVVLGRVLKHLEGPGWPGEYTAELEVLCIFKGPRLPPTVNITHAGNASDVCFSADLEVGGKYLIYLKQEKGGQLRPSNPPHPDHYKDEMYSMCDISVNYPQGVTNETSKEKCEDESADYDYSYDYEEEEEEGDDDEQRNCISFVPKPGADVPYQSVDADGSSGDSLRMSLLWLTLLFLVTVTLS